MLRHGHIYREEGSNWTLKHWRWMNTCQFNQAHERMVYDEYRSLINSFEERLVRLEEKIVEIAESPKYKAAVSKLRVFKGIDYIIALSVLCEIGDFRRFANAKDFMSYLGLVPTESSSGGKRNQGGITKAGNGHLRKLLIEGAWHYTRNTHPGKRLEKRREGCSANLIDIADRALHRLNKKFVKLVFRGKHKNVAVTALARELAGFIWAVQTSNVA
jgi:transposase